MTAPLRSAAMEPASRSSSGSWRRSGAGHVFADYGCAPGEDTDYPDVALQVAEAIARGEHERGILICGTGIGMAIVANKVPGVYAAQVHDPTPPSARASPTTRR